MAANTDSPRSDSGQQEAGYQPIRVLGKGAFGEAVLYRRMEDNMLVVWKEVDLSRLSDKERRDSQNEIDILSVLNHTNIVSYYNHFLDGDMLLIEMEYANGGCLAEKISRATELFSEDLVLWYFYQIAGAVAHIHEFSILHRDIKTLNIFLTKTDLVKLGDFGISKMLDTKQKMAESYVGTPYYMSPELIRGEPYDQKSDIWATGCVLYELLTLTRVFDATNPLKLAHAIVQNDFEKIHHQYSKESNDLLEKLLDKEPSQRPNALDILKDAVFVSCSEQYEKQVWDLDASGRRAKLNVSVSADVMPVVTSKSSEFYTWGGGKLLPQKFDIFQKGKSVLQAAIGKAHVAVVTLENELYTWSISSDGTVEMVGQLGHGDTAAYKAPKKVEVFEGIPVHQVACGDDFTICLTDEGEVYSFGSDYYGCLGCEGQEGEEVCTPVLLDFFSSRPVHMVSCGSSHVAALTRDGHVYTWGCGEYGRLGLGSEDDYSSPQKVETRGRHAISSVCAGPDGTFLVNSNGRVLACGSNEHNKLGFNTSLQGVSKVKNISYDIPYKNTFTTVKPLSKYNIVKIAAGQNHSAALDCFGHLFTFGSNQFGQLAVGDFKPRKGINRVRGPLVGKTVVHVACGDTFTTIATADNMLYSCGNMENGRMGISAGETGMGPKSTCYSLPRAVFGSLHLVSHLASRHWHTFLVAEKVLSQKTIRSSSALSRASLYESDGSTAGDEYRSSPAPSHESTDSGLESTGFSSFKFKDSCPPWLRAELEGCEVIPLSDNTDSSDGSAINTRETPLSLEQGTEELVGTCSDPADVVALLQTRLQELEARNDQLEIIVSQQSGTIELLKNQIKRCYSVSCRTWSGVNNSTHKP